MRIFSSLIDVRSLTLLVLLGAAPGAGAAEAPGPDFYRAFSFRVRPEGHFKVPTPSSASSEFHYRLETLGAFDSQFERPLVSDLRTGPASSSGFFRKFWDKLALKDGSYLELAGERIPLTCVYISGQDNRFSGRMSPVFPEFLLQVYLVANDFGCVGPLNPNWPASGTRRESWDTYLYYEIRDPTIMLPTEIQLRYRWAEYPSVLVDAGGTP